MLEQIGLIQATAQGGGFIDEGRFEKSILM